MLFVRCCVLVVVGWLWCFVCCFTVVARCSWFVAYLLLVVFLLVVGCVFGGRWSLFCGLLCIVCCLLVVRCVVRVVVRFLVVLSSWLLFVVCCLVFVGSWLLFVVCRFGCSIVVLCGLLLVLL